VLTIEIHEAQQENVAEGDRKRSKSTALTADNCGEILELLSGSKGSPGDFSTFAGASHGMPRTNRGEVKELRTSAMAQVATCTGGLYDRPVIFDYIVGESPFQRFLRLNDHSGCC
jgi:hypothetical protein